MNWAAGRVLQRVFHAVIVSKINKKKKLIYYAAHTDSHKKKDLEKYLTQKNSKKKAYAIAIKDSF